MDHRQNLLVGQSGGPTAVINSSLSGVLHGAAQSGRVGTVYGMLNGIEGYLEERKMNLSLLTKQERELLKTTPASFLGACRKRLPEELDDPLYDQLFQSFEKDGIGYFLYIGGNDSMDTVDKLTRAARKRGDKQVRFIGICKTIDNDLVYTDHTPGYGSAAKYVAASVRQMMTDAEVYTMDNVLIVECMGRDAGWVTAASVLARRFEGDNPGLIYLPESDFRLGQMMERIRALLKVRNTVVVCVSEGIHDSSGRLISKTGLSASSDVFGHVQMAGCGKILETVIKNEMNIKVRSVELNLPQRCSAVEASLTDVTEAWRCGVEGVNLALSGRTGQMVAMVREDTPDGSYRIRYEGVEVSKVCNMVRYFPREWITSEGTDIDKAYVSYALPLIQGESRPPMENGLPKFLYRDQSQNKRGIRK